MSEEITRRRALGYAAGGVAAASLGRMGVSLPKANAKGSTPVVSRGKTKIVVLGSQGGQNITQRTGSATRCGPSVLIDVGGQLTVVDCGLGTAHRLLEAGYEMNAVRNVIVTHFHADHIADLDSFVGFAWSSGRNDGNTKRRLDIYGPPGVKLYEKGLKQAWKLSIADQEGPLAQTPKFDDFAHWHEVKPQNKETKVFSHPRIEVSAIRVQHGGLPAIGYRVRTDDVDVVFSGDRGAQGDNFSALAAKGDVLFHEILARKIVVPVLESEGTSQSFIKHLLHDHCSPQAVGRIATEAGVETLVLYHLIPGTPQVSDQAWREMVEPYFDGTILVASDLMVV